MFHFLGGKVRNNLWDTFLSKSETSFRQKVKHVFFKKWNTFFQKPLLRESYVKSALHFLQKVRFTFFKKRVSLFLQNMFHFLDPRISHFLCFTFSMPKSVSHRPEEVSGLLIV